MDDIAHAPRSAAADARKGWKRLVLAGGTIVILAVAFAYGWHWWVVGRFEESTDDAYLQADNVSMGAEVGGHVVTVPVDDNQPVKAGDLLVQIEDREYKAALDEARANLAAAEADAANLAAQEQLQQTQISQTAAELQSGEAASISPSRNSSATNRWSPPAPARRSGSSRRTPSCISATPPSAGRAPRRSTAPSAS